MSDLTFINVYSPSLVIDADYEARYKSRSRLGLSEVGHECMRYLWYQHRGTPAIPPSGQTLRLFELGKLIERQHVADLMSAGYYVHSRQKELSMSWDNITLTGHIDGVIERLMESDKSHLLEVKSAKDEEFKKCKKLGYEAWHPSYAAQIQVYMLGMKLERCLIQVVNKNNSELYDERIKLKKSWAIETMRKVFVSISGNIPERTCPRADWYKAKWCKFYKTCFLTVANQN